MPNTAPPQIEHRELRHYAGVRARLSACEFAASIDHGWPRIRTWLAGRGLEPAGPPFIRYCVLGHDDTFEIDLGVPVDGPVASDGEVHAGVLPAGRYVVLRHTGPYDGLPGAHARLRRWAGERGVTFDRWPTGHGEAWRASAEHYLIDPCDEPDPARWLVELAYLTAA